MLNLATAKEHEAAPLQSDEGPSLRPGGHENSPAADLHDYFQTLFASLGPMGWWPGRTPFEIIVGAILTQNTAWTNVEKAIANLRREGLLTPRAIERVPESRLANLIKPSGYFRQKAKKLTAFVHFLRSKHGG